MLINLSIPQLQLIDEGLKQLEVNTHSGATMLQIVHLREVIKNALCSQKERQQQPMLICSTGLEHWHFSKGVWHLIFKRNSGYLFEGGKVTFSYGEKDSQCYKDLTVTFIAPNKKYITLERK